MGVEVTRLEEADEWNRLVDGAEGATPFHRYGCLQMIAEHADCELVPLVGYKGQEPVGLFPGFRNGYGPLRTAFSPPPNLSVTYLGPVETNFRGMKRRKRERRHRRFVEGALDALSDGGGLHYVNVRCGPAYGDPRQFVWRDFAPNPQFTYVVDLEPEPDDLLMSFSSDLRRNVRGVDGSDVSLSEEGVDGVVRVVRQAQRRHEEQDVFYGVTPAFVRDLARALPDDVIRSYVCRVDGDFVGGLVTLEDERTMYRWQGAADLDASVPAFDLLDWHAMQEARDRGLTEYDLVGANTERLCGYKAKFGPDVRPYYELERSARGVGLLKEGYKRLR